MKSFQYYQPDSLEDASKMAARDAKKNMLYAGGIDVLGLLKDDQIQPEILINLKNIQALSGIRREPQKGLRIGALTTLSELLESPLVNQQYPILKEAVREIASPQIRNVATVGGNLCQRPRCWYFRGDFHCLRKGGETCYAFEGENKYHCIIGGDPCFIVHPSDLAVALLALDSRLVIQQENREKLVPIQKFFVLPEDNPYVENILQPGDILKEIIVPEPSANVRSGFLKFKERGAFDFAVVSVGAVLQTENGVIRQARVAFGGVAPIPWMETDIQQKLVGLKATEQNISAVCQEFLKDASPLSQNAYKIPLARNLVKRLLMRLIQAA